MSMCVTMTFAVLLPLTVAVLGASNSLANATTSKDVSAGFPVAFSCFEYNADYTGGEITRFPTTTAEACQERCSKAEDCSFFNYHVLSSICVLRSGIPYAGSRKRNNVVSGPKECMECAEEGIAYGGKPIESATANSATHCQAICVANDSCEFFTFDTVSRTCDLLKDNSGESKAANKISGPKDCTPQPLGPAPPCAVHRVRYGSKALSTSKTEDAIGCQKVCQNSSSCEAFAFDTSSSECHLQLANSESNKKQNPTFISGPRECSPVCQKEGLDYAANALLENENTDVTVAEECQLRCQATTGCNAWSYASDSKACKLYKSESATQAAAGVVSGPKYCAGSCDIIGFHAPANGFKGSWYTTKTNQTLEQCRAACKAEAKCGVFTWWEKDKKCYLKDETCLRNQEPQKDVVATGWAGCSTCFRQGVGYKTGGNELLWELLAENAEECRARCALMEHCTRFTYDAATKNCSFLSGESGDVPGEHLQSGPSHCVPDNSCYLQDTQWQHNDNIGWSRDTPSDPKGCQELCASDVRCRFWTFYTPTKECFLKTGVNGKPILTLALKGWVSGPKKCMKVIHGCEETKIDYAKSDIYTAEFKLDSIEACRQACYNEPQCRIFTYNRVNKNCWKKVIAGFSSRKTAEQSDSGSRLGCPKCLRAGIEYTGGLIKEINYGAGQFTPCQLACEADARCRVFTYIGNNCRLLENEGNVKEAPYTTVSGPKHC